MTIFELLSFVLMSFVLAVLIYYRKEIEYAVYLKTAAEEESKPAKGKKLFERNEAAVQAWREERHG